MREVLAQRILWAAPSAFIAVFLMSGWRAPGWREIARRLTPRMIGTLTLSSCFIFVNWGIYVYLVLNERVIEVRAGVFPRAAGQRSAVGVLFFKEDHVAQIIALALALVGVVVQGFALGRAAVDGAGALRDVVDLRRHPQARASAGRGRAADRNAGVGAARGRAAVVDRAASAAGVHQRLGRPLCCSRSPVR